MINMQTVDANNPLLSSNVQPNDAPPTIEGLKDQLFDQALTMSLNQMTKSSEEIKEVLEKANEAE